MADVEDDNIIPLAEGTWSDDGILWFPQGVVSIPIRAHCCPECEASNVECRRDPDDDRRCVGHVCHSCGATTETHDG